MDHPEVIGTWMSCGESPHDIAFIKGPNGKLHHFAYHLEDWSAILRAGDIQNMQAKAPSTQATRRRFLH